MPDDIKIEDISEDSCYKTKCISGLPVEEVNEVLNDGNAGLERVMKKHGLGNTFDCWHNGYGIYSIRHVGEHLFIQIGRSCD